MATPMQEAESLKHDFKRESQPATLATVTTDSEVDGASMYTTDRTRASSITSFDADELPPMPKLGAATYPPRPAESRESVASFASGSSGKKARPESMLAGLKGPLMLGIALVDFNHLVGPRIEWSKGPLFERDDEKLSEILPFLALPDGAHLSEEDYSYFHIVPQSTTPTTVFGISCNRQIASSELLVKGDDVTRTTVQKAVVVLASKPIFGLLRDRLGVITRALFDQRDFSELGILADFYESLEMSMRSQLTESGLYMGTSLRELVHTFRQRTLVLLKGLIVQKRIMFSGHPVERLCTHQYSLISLVPGLLQTLEDCGSPVLAARAPTLERPSSLKTSDRRSMTAFLGLPLDIFGKDAFFQPYLPLQQLDMMKETQAWLCGSTNSIVTQSKEIDMLVNLETGALEFRNPAVERLVSLTAADRKWMDELVRDVNESWNDDDPSRPTGMAFKGSDDYLRSKFEEYIHAALASIKYSDFLAKGDSGGVGITGSGGDANSANDFNPAWIADFRRTNAYEVWNRVTDPMLFDIVEPRHPCGEKPSVVADIGLRLSEGIQELKLEQQLAPAREAVSRTITAGSTGLFKAVEGVRSRWMQRQSSSSNIATTPKSGETSGASTPVEITRTDVDALADMAPPPTPGGMRPLSLVTAQQNQQQQQQQTETKPAAGGWGGGFGSFLSTRWSKGAPPPPPLPEKDNLNPPLPDKDRPEPPPTPLPTGVAEIWQPRDLDAVSASRDASRDALEGKTGEQAHLEPPSVGMAM